MNRFRLDPEKSLYFIYAETAGLIKIGITQDLERRLQTLQTATGDRLHVLHSRSGDRELEAYFHRAYSGSRVRGEWFRPSWSLLIYLEVTAGPYVFKAFPELREIILKGEETR